MYINIQLHKNKDFFSNSGPFFRFCKTKKPGFPGFRARCAAFAVAGNRKRLRRPSNPLSGRTRVFALANSKKNEFCASKSRSVRARKNPLSKVSNKNWHFRVFRKKQFKNLQQNFKNFRNIWKVQTTVCFIFSFYTII